MDKFTFKTADGVDVNLEKLSQAFPEVITETMGEDGKIKRVADFEKLKMLLGDSAAERPQEFYEFTWPGKNEAIFEAAKATTKTLRPCPEESKNWDTTQNLYIEGDNLEALKILQEAYLGKVKMIYIDPPYNTGKDFVYRDNFHKSAEEGKADETVRDEETDSNLFQNTESNGRFHSDWCSMIYPRLKLARDLLSDDGVIFISIDDNEVHNLRKICDEVFGIENFVTNFCWRRRKTQANLAKFTSQVHEYIATYAKDISNLNFNRLPYSTEYIEKAFSNPDNDPKGLYQTGPLARPANSSNREYVLKMPNGRQIKAKWSCSQSTFDKYIEENRLFIPKEGNGMPRIKIYLSELPGMLSNTWIDNLASTDDAARMIANIMGSMAFFEYSKPVELLSFFMNIGTDRSALILDFFSGSATTAHACMQLNLPEVCAPDSEAAKAGYKNICEIGKERIRRAGEKIKAEHATTAPNLDIGFRVLKIDESIMKDVFYSPNETSQDLLSTLESNIKEDRTDLDLLFACLVDWGVELSMPLKTEEIEGVEIHTMNDGDTPALIACFAQNIPETVVRKIAALHPLRAVFRDSSFADSPAKINLTEIFKTYSPETDVKVL